MASAQRCPRGRTSVPSSRLESQPQTPARLDNLLQLASPNRGGVLQNLRRFRLGPRSGLESPVLRRAIRVGEGLLVSRLPPTCEPFSETGALKSAQASTDAASKYRASSRTHLESDAIGLESSRLAPELQTYAIVSLKGDKKSTRKRQTRRAMHVLTLKSHLGVILWSDVGTFGCGGDEKASGARETLKRVKISPTPDSPP